MAIKKIFIDEDNNELECYLNNEGKVYINVGKDRETPHYSGYIVLDRDDVEALIQVLMDAKNEM